MLYWPKDGKCYTRLTKGPCTKGKLLVLNEEDLAECQVSLTTYFLEKNFDTKWFIIIIVTGFKKEFETWT